MKRWLAAFWQSVRRWLRNPRVIWKSKPGSVPQVQVEAQSFAPFVAFLLVLAWTILFPSAVAMMSAAALGGLLLGSLYWAFQMARGVRAARQLRFAAMQVGDELEEEVQLINTSPLPVIWAEFSDQSNIPGYSLSSARAAAGASKTEWRAHTVCTRRGIFRLGPWELRTGEPFGLLLVRQVYEERREILVYPPLAELPERLLPHHGAFGEHHPLNAPLPAETILASSVRPFSPGDSLRRVHWRTFARRGMPFVKVFAPEAASSVWLLPDFDAAAHLTLEGSAALTGEPDAAFSPLLRSSLETMVTVTASLAAELLQQRLSVGMLASAASPLVVMPGQGQQHVWSILQALAPLEAGELGLTQALPALQRLLRGDDLMIVITPSTSPAWMDSLLRLAKGSGAARAEVILLDPRSFGGSSSPEPLLNALVARGVAATTLRAADVRLISGSYGELNRWEFKVTGYGRAIASKTPFLPAMYAGQERLP